MRLCRQLLHKRSCATLPSARAAKGALALPAALDRLVEQGRLKPDPEQRALCEQLETLRQQIHAHRLATERYAEELQRWRTVCERLAAEAAAEEERRAAAPAWRQVLHRFRTALGIREPPAASSDGAGAPNPAAVPTPDLRPSAGSSPNGAAAPAADAVADSKGGVSPAAQDEPPYRRLRMAQARAHEDSGDHPPTGEPPPAAAPEEPRMQQHQGERLSPQELRHPFWRTGIGAAEAAAQVATDSGKAGSAGAAALAALPPNAPAPPRRPAAPRGLFIHGSVGSGKTLLMDLFVEALLADARVGRHRGVSGGGAGAAPYRCPVTLRRVHHNAFMIECHRRLHAHTDALAAEMRAASAGRPRRWGGASAGEASACDADDAFSPTARAQQQAPGWREAWVGGSGLGIRSVVEQLVQRMVAEGGRSRAEESISLARAMGRISADIVAGGVGVMSPAVGAHAARAAGGGEGAGKPSEAGGVVGEAVGGSAHVSGGGEAPLAPVLLDDTGRPVSVGVLCYDEVQMMDVADATVLRGVLGALLDAGWLLVATCNRTPDQFAASVMHRQHPQARFSEAMRAHCDTRVLGTGQNDYRTGLDAAHEPSFFFRGEGAGQASCPTLRLDRCFDRLTDGAAAEEAAPIGAGRELRLLAGGGVARASFHRLCDAALGAGDYVALAQRYHTLCVDALPQMSLQQRDQVRRELRVSCVHEIDWPTGPPQRRSALWWVLCRGTL